jgi:hypothetical protein
MLVNQTFDNLAYWRNIRAGSSAEQAPTLFSAHRV